MKSNQTARFQALATNILAWLRSLNAKLFIAMALLTSVLTLAVAISVVSGFKRSIETYTKDLALGTARGVIEDISRLDPELKFRRETSEILATWVNPESVRQIDLFADARVDGEDYLEVWATSEARPEAVSKDDAEIRKIMELAEEKAELIRLASGQEVWRIYVPILDAKTGKVKLLLRAYCGLDRWDAVWSKALASTLRTIPIVLLIEFIVLWALTSAFVRRPMHKIMGAMKSLGEGDVSARANLARDDELGEIARHFDRMAVDLQKTDQERGALLAEVQGFNSTLQKRIDEASSELRAKNKELELLMDRVSLMREELGQQDRLAVAGQLTAAFAHEVGTPLNLVKSHLQLLINEPTLYDGLRDRLNTIHVQIDRVEEIVRKLLSHTRPIEPKLESVPLAPLLEGLQRLWAPSLSAHKVLFKASLPDGCSLLADPKQLEQLFINLVNNSLDAMPSGGSITLEAGLCQSSEWEFVLHDTGVGIPLENLGKVFKPMFTTKPEGKGTGLGLSICREIVRAHGGEISIESVQGQGTKVRLKFPKKR